MPIELPIKSGKYLKGGDFNIPGLVLTITREPQAGPHPKFTDRLTNEPQEGFFYWFRDVAGEEKELFSASCGLASAMNAARVDVGDTVSIYKEGEGYKTKYFVVKLTRQAQTLNVAPTALTVGPVALGSQPVTSSAVNQDIDMTSIPF